MDTNVSSGEIVTAYCIECGRQFPIEDMISHGTARVCAGCKPRFLQKLVEGADIQTSKLQYAGVGIRFAAMFLDGIFLWIVSFGIQLGVLRLTVSQAVGLEPTNAIFVALIQQFLGIAIGVSYDALMVGRYGATLGKMACHLKVVTADGGRVSYMRAAGRYFAKLLSTLTLLIGFIIAIFDSQKRTLHDRICNTRVVMN